MLALAVVFVSALLFFCTEHLGLLFLSVCHCPSVDVCYRDSLEPAANTYHYPGSQPPQQNGSLAQLPLRLPVSNLAQAAAPKTAF